MKLINDCMNCKHGYNKLDEQPCNTCVLTTPSNWEKEMKGK